MKSNGASVKEAVDRLIPADRTTRIMSLSSLVNTFGNGLFMTVEVVYFTQIVGISVTKLAVALSIAGGISLMFSIPAGHLADRIGHCAKCVHLCVQNAISPCASLRSIPLPTRARATRTFHCRVAQVVSMAF